MSCVNYSCNLNPQCCNCGLTQHSYNNNIDGNGVCYYKLHHCRNCNRIVCVDCDADVFRDKRLDDTIILNHGYHTIHVLAFPECRFCTKDLKLIDKLAILEDYGVIHKRK